MIEVNKTWQIDSNYSIRFMSKEEFDPLLQENGKKFFEEKSQIFRLRDALNEVERSKIKKLSETAGNFLELRLGVFRGSEFIGWNYSRQESAFNLYMQNSAIFPEFRRQGLYTELLKKVVSIGTEIGFQTIYSRHVSTNNDVIIAKLKLGFKITSLEVSDLFGTLVIRKGAT